MSRSLLLAAVLALAAPATASASLGGPASSVDDDRVRTESALVGISRTDAYAVHQLQSPTGTVVKEFVSPAGTVFAVTWQGPWLPDMKQLLGDYFARYQTEMQSRSGRHRRGPVVIDTPDLVVHMSGHPRSFSGRAYVPQLVPAGVEAASLR